MSETQPRAALEALSFHAITGPEDGAFTRHHAKALIDHMASMEAALRKEQLAHDLVKCELRDTYDAMAEEAAAS